MASGPIDVDSGGAIVVVTPEQAYIADQQTALCIGQNRAGGQRYLIEVLASGWDASRLSLQQRPFGR